MHLKFKYTIRASSLAVFMKSFIYRHGRACMVSEVELGFGDSIELKKASRLKECLLRCLLIIYQQGLHIGNEI
jgi:hypothetical protein